MRPSSQQKMMRPASCQNQKMPSSMYECRKKTWGPARGRGSFTPVCYKIPCKKKLYSRRLAGWQTASKYIFWPSAVAEQFLAPLCRQLEPRLPSNDSAKTSKQHTFMYYMCLYLWDVLGLGPGPARPQNQKWTNRDRIENHGLKIECMGVIFRCASFSIWNTYCFFKIYQQN